MDLIGKWELQWRWARSWNSGIFRRCRRQCGGMYRVLQWRNMFGDEIWEYSGVGGRKLCPLTGTCKKYYWPLPCMLARNFYKNSMRPLYTGGKKKAGQQWTRRKQRWDVRVSASSGDYHPPHPCQLLTMHILIDCWPPWCRGCLPLTVRQNDVGGEVGARPAHHCAPYGWCSSMGCKALVRREGASLSLSHGPEQLTLEAPGEVPYCLIQLGAGCPQQGGEWGQGAGDLLGNDQLYGQL